jgi:hypothetical protein
MSGRGNGQATQPQSWPPETQVTVTLSLGVWNTVLGCVAKQSWEVADPLMQIIRQQIANELQLSAHPPSEQPDARVVPSQPQHN